VQAGDATSVHLGDLTLAHRDETSAGQGGQAAASIGLSIAPTSTSTVTGTTATAAAGTTPSGPRRQATGRVPRWRRRTARSCTPSHLRVPSSSSAGSLTTTATTCGISHSSRARTRPISSSSLHSSLRGVGDADDSVQTRSVGVSGAGAHRRLVRGLLCLTGRHRVGDDARRQHEGRAVLWIASR
jgi:hypothetical protein